MAKKIDAKPDNSEAPAEETPMDGSPLPPAQAPAAPAGKKPKEEKLKVCFRLSKRIDERLEIYHRRMGVDRSAVVEELLEGKLKGIRIGFPGEKLAENMSIA